MAPPSGLVQVGPVSPQPVLVRHAGGILKLPLLPHDSVRSLRLQLAALGLRSNELSDLDNYEQLQDAQTMEQAGIWNGRRPVFMAKAPAAAASSSCAASPSSAAAAASASDDAWSLWIHRKAMQIYVSFTKQQRAAYFQAVSAVVSSAAACRGSICLRCLGEDADRQDGHFDC